MAQKFFLEADDDTFWVYDEENYTWLGHIGGGELRTSKRCCEHSPPACALHLESRSHHLQSGNQFSYFSPQMCAK